MDQEKIGKFIAECRKEKELTQSQLAEKLGVTDKTISNWENARCMPDLTLFKPLTDILGVTINELMSGERVDDEHYQEKLEENVFGVLAFINDNILKKKRTMFWIAVVLGAIVSLAAMTVFESDSSWGSIFAIFGCVVSSVGAFQLVKAHHMKRSKIFVFAYVFIYLIVLMLVDFASVMLMRQAPRFSYLKEYSDNIILYHAPFYRVYCVNYGSNREYFIIDTKGEYDEDTVPNVPFDRDKAGIDNIVRFKNANVGNNSNTGNLINNLPLSEYGYTFEIDSENNGLVINYHMTDWYIEERGYLRKALIYDAVALFVLIDNLKYVEFNFSGEVYDVSREDILEYPHFEEICKEKVDKEKFNLHLESKIKDEEFVDEMFSSIIGKKANS